MPLTQVQPGMLGAPQPYNFKNRIINGAMVINQRNESTSVNLASSRGAGYNIDRWSVWLANWTGGAGTQQRSTDVPAGAGFVNSLLTTVTTGSTSPDPSSGRYLINQMIEGFNIADLMWGTAAAKTITLSFWVKSSVTGNYGFSLTNSAGNRAYVLTYTVVSANTWEYKTITIPGDTSGTWTTDNTAGITLNYDLGVVGPTTNTLNTWLAGDFRGVTSSVKLINTTGATFRITGVQFEVGVSATDFDVRPYGTELMLCQRYFQKIAATSGSGYDNFANPVSYSSGSSSFRFQIYLPVVMRTPPSFTQVGNFVLLGVVSGAVSGMSIADSGGNPIVGMGFVSPSAGSAGQSVILRANNDTTAAMLFSAEL